VAWATRANESNGEEHLLLACYRSFKYVIAPLSIKDVSKESGTRHAQSGTSISVFFESGNPLKNQSTAFDRNKASCSDGDKHSVIFS
jgi:hypothetical protein